MERENNFDLIRLCAALQVALGHGLAHLEGNDTIANLLGFVPGVPVFFVISGFLVSASYERSTLKQYALNRALRIYPALWTCLAVSVAIASACGVSFARRETLPWLAAQLSIAQFYNPDFLRPFGVGVLNGSLWTIAVELQFYVCVPLILKFKRALPAVLVISLVMRQIHVAHYTHDSLLWKLSSVSLAPYLYMFLLGVLAHIHFERLERFIVGQAGWWIITFFLSSAALNFLGGEVRGSTLNPIVAATLGLAMLSSAYTFPFLGKRLNRNDWSYGLYIYHMPVINVFVAAHLTGTSRTLSAVACALLLASLSWRFIERPALRFKRPHSPSPSTFPEIPQSYTQHPEIRPPTVSD